MDNFTSSDLINRMERTLKEAINNVMDSFDPNHQNFKQEIENSINTKMRALSSQLSFYFSPTFSEIEITNFSYASTNCSNEGVMTGDLVVMYCEKPDFAKYGGPGYAGKEDGQLCEYPKHSGKFYKWNEFFCRWEDIYKDIDRGSNGQSWHDKLTNNAAFEPWWGNNTSGGNYLRSDRKRNGADDLWGDPGVRSYMGTFKQISADVMKSIYRFTLNLKSAIGHYEKLSDAFGFGDEENKKEIIESESPKRGPEDTTTFILHGKGHDIKSKRYVNGFRSEIKGLSNAKRDSAFHVNTIRGSIQLEVIIKKKYE